MMAMKNKVVKALLAAGVSISLLLAGCSGGSGSSNNSTQTASGATGSNSTAVPTYKVVTSSVYPPFCFLNDNNELDGFDVDVMKAVDQVDDRFNFTYEWCDWSSMLPGLDAGRYDVCVYELSYSDQRASQYHYGTKPYADSAGAAVITTDKHANWKTWDDIAAAKNATVGVVVGGSYCEQAENYLDKHPNAFQLKYYDSEIDAVLEDVSNGRVDCCINDGSVALYKAKKAGINNLIVPGEVEDPNPVWCVYPNTDLGKKLSPMVDEDLQKLYDNGELAKIAVKWFGKSDVIDDLKGLGYYD